MNKEELANLIDDSPLSKHREFLIQKARASISISRVKGKSETGKSRFGGSPDLPKGTKWPTHALGNYQFFAQINFEEVPDLDGLLPKTGILSLFVAWDENGESFWQDPGYIHAQFFKNDGTLETINPPKDVQFGSSSNIRFKRSMSLPQNAEQVEDWPLSNDEDNCYSEFTESLDMAEDHLLGYPYNLTLGYDPTPGPDWITLITLNSDDTQEWCWHDGDRLVIFITKEDLKNQNFSNLKSDAG